MKKNNKHIATEYEPTQKEKDLIEVLLNPKYRMKTIQDICRIADCNRATYYRAFSKPEFVEYYKKQSLEMVKQHIGPVINSFVTEAKRGSFTHGKVILEMAGIYMEKQHIEHSGETTQNVKQSIDLSNLTDEELNMLEKLAKKTEGG